MGNTSSDPTKEKLQLTIAHEFLLVYNLMTDSAFKVMGSGKPPEPDVLCKDARTGEQIGIEIGSAYYDGAHAKAVWEPARGRHTEAYSLTQRDYNENVRALAQAMRIVRKKGKKGYRVSGRLLLIVFTYPWRLYLSDVQERLETLRVPRSHLFNEIYIMSQHGEVYCLFPKQGWILQ